MPPVLPPLFYNNRLQGGYLDSEGFGSSFQPQLERFSFPVSQSNRQDLLRLPRPSPPPSEVLDLSRGIRPAIPTSPGGHSAAPYSPPQFDFAASQGVPVDRPMFGPPQPLGGFQSTPDAGSPLLDRLQQQGRARLNFATPYTPYGPSSLLSGLARGAGTSGGGALLNDLGFLGRSGLTGFSTPSQGSPLLSNLSARGLGGLTEVPLEGRDASSGVLRSLAQTSQDLLGSGGQLSADEQRDITQGALSGFADRGLLGPAAASAAVLDTSRARRQRQLENIGVARGIEGLLQQQQSADRGFGLARQAQGFGQAATAEGLRQQQLAADRGFGLTRQGQAFGQALSTEGLRQNQLAGDRGFGLSVEDRLQGQRQADRQFGLNQRGQAFNEATTAEGLRQQQLSADRGFQLGAGGFNLARQGQAFGQALDANRFNLQAEQADRGFLGDLARLYLGAAVDPTQAVLGRPSIGVGVGQAGSQLAQQFQSPLLTDPFNQSAFGLQGSAFRTQSAAAQEQAARRAAFLSSILGFGTERVFGSGSVA